MTFAEGHSLWFLEKWKSQFSGGHLLPTTHSIWLFIFATPRLELSPVLFERKEGMSKKIDNALKVTELANPKEFSLHSSCSVLFVPGASSGGGRLVQRKAEVTATKTPGTRWCAARCAYCSVSGAGRACRAWLAGGGAAARGARRLLLRVTSASLPGGSWKPLKLV